MAGEWPVVRLGDLTASISETHKFGKDDLVFLNTSDILLGKFLHHSYSPVRDWPGQAKKSIQKGDILFSEIRPANGRWAFVDIDATDYVVSTKLMVIRSTTNRLLPRFLYHFLTSDRITGWLQHLAESRSGTFPQITFDQVAELDVTLPPLSVQGKISSFLDAIEYKIDLNQQMNETIEAIARALFKSWFVDFDVTRAKAEGRDTGLPNAIADLFRASFEESELGAIPKGWQVVDLGSCCRKVAMGPFGSDIKTDNFIDSGVPVVRGGNLTKGFVDDGFVFLSDTKADELRNANAFPGDIVITHRGTLGQVGIVPVPSRFPRYVVSQSQMLLSVNPERATPRYVFEYLRSPAGQHALLANTSQTGVPAISRPTTSLKTIRLLLPPLLVLQWFERTTSALAAREVEATNESGTLADLRDALLPKLISGELRIKDAEHFVSETV